MSIKFLKKTFIRFRNPKKLLMILIFLTFLTEGIYLQLRSYHPIKWHSWQDQTFAKAMKAQKPIFLSIEDSDCYECMMMERESFINKEVANLLNNHFICIKVSRQEYPEIEEIYKTYVKNSLGMEKWPLNLFLKPTKEPFYGRPYLPKDQFIKTLKKVIQIWETKKD